MPLFGPPNIDKLKEKRDIHGLIKALRHKEAAMLRIPALTLMCATVFFGAACLGGGGPLAKIQTPDGQYSITKVKAGNFEASCSGTECEIDTSGVHFATRTIIVWLKPDLPQEFGGFESWLVKHCIGEVETDEIYVRDKGGNEYVCTSYNVKHGEEGVEEESALVFYCTIFSASPSPCYYAGGGGSTPKDFTLFVPGNSPINLGK